MADLADGFARNLSRGVVGELLGGSPGEWPERYAAASPIAMLPLGVPQLLLHGDVDDTVPVGISRTYTRAAASSGDTCELVEFPGMGHMEFLDPAREPHAVLCRWLERRVGSTAAGG